MASLFTWKAAQDEHILNLVSIEHSFLSFIQCVRYINTLFVEP